MASPALIVLYGKCIANEQSADKQEVQKLAEKYMRDANTLVHIEPKKCREVVAETTSHHVAERATWLRDACKSDRPHFPAGWHNAITLGFYDYTEYMGNDPRVTTQLDCVKGRLLVNLMNAAGNGEPI